MVQRQSDRFYPISRRLLPKVRKKKLKRGCASPGVPAGQGLLTMAVDAGQVGLGACSPESRSGRPFQWPGALA